MTNVAEIKDRPDGRMPPHRKIQFVAQMLSAIGFLAVWHLHLNAQGQDAASQARLQYDRFIERVGRSNTARENGKADFLWLAEAPGRIERARYGEIVIERLDHGVRLEGAMLHNWIAGMFVPAAETRDILTVFLDYDRYPEIYPGVISSRLLQEKGGVFNIWQRLQRGKIVLDTWHEAGYRNLDATRTSTWSNATKIREVVYPGESREKLLPPGQDSGYMWRLNIYWRFEQAHDGVFAECHSMTLTRDIPWLFRWLIGPLVERLPRNALMQSLEATRREAKRLARLRGASSHVQSTENPRRTDTSAHEAERSARRLPASAATNP